MTKILFCLVIGLTILLAACSGGSGIFPGVYKTTLQQGSKITQDMVDKLRPGMTKPQVRFVLGTPLIADTFDQDRWDYFFVLKRADGSEVKEHLSVFFVDDLLDSFEGDFTPTAEGKSEQESALGISLDIDESDETEVTEVTEGKEAASEALDNVEASAEKIGTDLDIDQDEDNDLNLSETDLDSEPELTKSEEISDLDIDAEAVNVEATGKGSEIQLNETNAAASNNHPR